MNPFLLTFVTANPYLSVFIYGVFALLVGSVLSMVIYRLPIMLDHQASPCFSETSSPFNLWVPRSHCQGCKKKIPAYHNVPVFSYIILRGRCAFCNQRISWQYPCIELLTLLLSLIALYHFGYQSTLLAALPFIWLTLCLSFIDFNRQWLPDCLTLSLLWIGLLINTQSIFCPLSSAVWSAAGAYTALWLFVQLFYALTGKIGMGHGDFKLFAALGAWFGWLAFSKILLVACLLGSITGLIYLRVTRQSRHTPIPFGPYLCLAGWVQLFTFPHSF